MKRILALAILLAVTSSPGCSTEQPTPKPNLKAHLHQTLTGHSEVVWEVAFSPDSQLLATGSDDSSVKLWRMKDAAPVHTLTGGSEHVYAVAFSPDGRWLASGSREKGAVGRSGNSLWVRG